LAVDDRSRASLELGFLLPVHCASRIVRILQERVMEASGLLERIRRCAMPDGTFECQGTWLQQEGEMRFTPNRPWLPFRAKQRFPGTGIDFRWEAQVRIAPSVRAHVIDSFEGGRGMLTARVLGFVPVARSRGPATDKGEAMRGRPSFLGDRSLSAKRRAFAGKQWLQTNCGPLSMMGGPGQRSSSRSMPRDTCLAALRPVVRGWS
jgi:hypothetical protein